VNAITPAASAATTIDPHNPANFIGVIIGFM
jgi:hypothetical protein